MIKVTKYGTLRAKTPGAGLSAPVINSVQQANSAAYIALSTVEGAASYTAEYSSDGGGTWLTTFSLSTYVPITGLSNNTPYRLRVKASDGSTDSAYAYLAGFFMCGDNVGKTNIVGFGDSNMKDGGALSPSPNTLMENLADILDPFLYEGFYNRGSGGDDVPAILFYCHNGHSGYPQPAYSSYNPAVSKNIAVIQYGTNDMTIKGWTAQQFIDNTKAATAFLASVGFMCVLIASGPPSYGDPAKYQYASDYFVNNTGDMNAVAVLNLMGNTTLYGVGSTMWDGLHYYPSGQAYIADLLSAKIDEVQNIVRIIPATLSGISWDAGSQHMTFTPSAGYLATDYEYCTDWDGVVGTVSNFTACTTNSITISETVPVGKFALRVKATKNNPPGNKVLNGGQLN